MSAAAVDAVRRGLRIAFCWASRPVMLLVRSAGHVSKRVAGRAISGLSIATPMNTSAPAMPTSIAALLPSAAEEPVDERDEPDDRERPCPTRSGGDPTTAGAPGRAAPRSAGPARRARAGAIADTNVTRVPTISETTIVRGWICSGPLGRSMPNAREQRLERLHDRDAEHEADTDEKRPTTSASSATEPTTWRPDAPSARRSPSSRVRCATVIENVL